MKLQAVLVMPRSRIVVWLWGLLVNRNRLEGFLWWASMISLRIHQLVDQRQIFRYGQHREGGRVEKACRGSGEDVHDAGGALQSLCDRQEQGGAGGEDQQLQMLQVYKLN